MRRERPARMAGQGARRRLLTRGAFVLVGGVALAIAMHHTRPAPPAPPRDVPPSFTAALQTGDLIFRRGVSAESRAVRAMGRDRAAYSHVGLVVRDSERVFVVHALPRDRARGIRGGVRREPVSTFLNAEDAEQAAAYRVTQASPEARARAVAWADSTTEVWLPFDDDFDGRTPDRVYCTEFVLRAYGAGKLALPARTRHVVLLGRAYDVVFPASLLADTSVVRVAELGPTHAP